MSRPGSPPRFASLLLGLCVPPGPLGQALLGDLHEMYLEMGALWYWRQVPRVGGRYLFRRVVHRGLYRSLQSPSGEPRPAPPRGQIMDNFAKDLRFTFRSLRRAPGFLIATVLVLGIGIGAASLMFSTFDTVVLRPLPFDDPDALIWAWGMSESMPNNTISYDDYVDYRDGTDAFESLGASMVFRRTRVITGSEGAEQVMTYFVSANLFATLGIDPEIGRHFVPSEETSGQDQVAILSQAFWQRRYSGDPDVLGTTITLDGQPAQVVGVMPADFNYPAGADVWYPLQRDAGYANGRGNNNFAVLGRLRAEATIEEAQAQVDVIARNIATEFPDSKSGSWLTLEPLHERFFGPVRDMLLVLAGVILLVPLIACANVASLFMARAIGRRSELAARLALGASRGRVVRQLLTEGLVVALAGCVVGLLLAYLGGEALRLFAPAALPRLNAIGINAAVLAVTLFTALVMVPLFSLAPAIRGTDMRIADTLKAGSQRGGSGRGSKFRNSLVVTQVALSLALMLASALFVQTFVNLQDAESGFESEGVLNLFTLLPAFKYEAVEQIDQTWDQVHERLAALPGVRAVGFADRLPPGGRGPMNYVHAAERPPADAADRVAATRRFVSNQYFEALAIPLRSGRLFEAHERFDWGAERGVVVVNETLARLFFPGDEPLGKAIVMSGINLEIVGIAGDIYETGPGMEPTPTFYLPARGPLGRLGVVVRVDGDPLAVAPVVRDAIKSVDEDITISSMQTMEARIGGRLFQPGFRSVIVGVFALIGLLLSSIGLYAVLAYFVRQRRHEISVRLALGARTEDVAGLVVKRGMILVGVGISVGVVGALAGGRLLQSLLYGVGTTDPVTLVSVSLFLVAVALIACAAPALRAARLDPAEVLKEE